jgi:hypothetical protein
MWQQKQMETNRKQYVCGNDGNNHGYTEKVKFHIRRFDTKEKNEYETSLFLCTHDYYHHFRKHTAFCWFPSVFVATSSPSADNESL